MISKISEPKLEEYLAHIERYEKHPIVTRVLAQDSSFYRTVQDFYDLSTWEGFVAGAGSVREFDFKKEDPQKRGGYPADLVEILGGFSEEPFDTNKLQYDSVREDYQRWNAPSRKVKRTIAVLGGMLTGVGGIGTCIASAIIRNSEIAIPAGFVAAGGLVTYFWAGAYYPKPKGSNDELGEYVKLNKSADKADSFMDKHYRTHFIKKALSIK